MSEWNIFWYTNLHSFHMEAEQTRTQKAYKAHNISKIQKEKWTKKKKKMKKRKRKTKECFTTFELFSINTNLMGRKTLAFLTQSSIEPASNTIIFPYSC